MTPHEVAERFDARSVGDGQWEARCPAHDDGQASLSLGTGDDDRVLVKCHAGCDTADVLDAVGLRIADLFPPADGSPVSTHADHSAGGLVKLDADGMKALNAKLCVSTLPKPARAMTKPPVTLDTVVMRTGRAVGGREAGRWLYQDRDGADVAAVVRYETAKGKTYRQFHRNGQGWTAKAMNGKRPLYGLPRLCTGQGAVYVTEGEKAADAARGLGLVATTSMQGSQSAGKSDWPALAGRDVVILPDHDDAGESYADAVCGLLADLSPQPAVKVVKLPDLPVGGDIVEYVESRRQAGEADATMRAGIEAMAMEAEAVKLRPATATKPARGVTSTPKLIRMSDVVPVDVRWLWPGRIPLGRLTLLVGRPGDGKSFLTAYLAANVSRGRPWVDSSPCPAGSVVLVSAEDDPADTIAPRLIAHGADRDRVHVLAGVTSRKDNGSETDSVFTLADIEPLRQTLQQVDDCRLIVIDPIGSYLGGRADAHRDNEVRGVLAPICHLAAEYDAAVLAVAHTRKSAAAYADDMAMGSRAFTGLARSVLHLMADPDDEHGRLLLPGKNNLNERAAGLAFDIGPGEIDGRACIRWHDNEVTITADEAVNREPAGRGRQTERDEAASWLRLALSNGPREAKDLLEQAKEGEGISRRTLERAKKVAGVIAYQPKIPGPWWWQLSPPEMNGPPDRQPDRQPDPVE